MPVSAWKTAVGAVRAGAPPDAADGAGCSIMPKRRGASSAAVRIAFAIREAYLPGNLPKLQ
jgi:hypothetical protein